MFPSLVFAQTTIPKSEEEFFARYLYQRAIEAQISPTRLIAVSVCESGLRSSTPPNSNKNGTIDTSLMRINSIHSDTASKMGLNLNEYDDNVSFAIYLISLNGWQDWRYSQKCWTSPKTIQQVYKFLSLDS